MKNLHCAEKMGAPAQPRIGVESRELVHEFNIIGISEFLILGGRGCASEARNFWIFGLNDLLES